MHIIQKKRQFYESAYPLRVFTINCTHARTNTHAVPMISVCWLDYDCFAAIIAPMQHKHEQFILVLLSRCVWPFYFLCSIVMTMTHRTHSHMEKSTHARAKTNVSMCANVFFFFNANVKENTNYMRNEKWYSRSTIAITGNNNDTMTMTTDKITHALTHTLTSILITQKCNKSSLRMERETNKNIYNK